MTRRAKLKVAIVSVAVGYLLGRSVQVVRNTHAMVERQEGRYITHQQMRRRACWGAFPLQTFNVTNWDGVPDVICFEPRTPKERAAYLAHYGQRRGRE